MVLWTWFIAIHMVTMLCTLRIRHWPEGRREIKPHFKFLTVHIKKKICHWRSDLLQAYFAASHTNIPDGSYVTGGLGGMNPDWTRKVHCTYAPGWKHRLEPCSVQKARSVVHVSRTEIRCRAYLTVLMSLIITWYCNRPQLDAAIMVWLTETRGWVLRCDTRALIGARW